MQHSLPLATLLAATADAVQAVRSGRSLNDVLAACPAPARPGVQALSFEVLRRLGTALALRRLLAAKAPPPAVDALLLAALALLLPDPATADDGAGGGPAYAPHTLVDQAVKAVRQKKAANAGFVNAVLRRFLRERDGLLKAVETDPQARFNHPAWWIERLQADWPAHWQALLAANNRRAPMVLRVNRRRGTAAQYLERLRAAGLAGSALALPAPVPGGAESDAIVLEEPVPVQQLPGFDAGDVSVQDAAAQLAAHLLLAEAPGLAPLPAAIRVLDACAAPGGKTAHLLEMADRPIEVLALDRDPQRLRRVDETLARIGLNAATLAADAADTAAWWDGRPFDAILLDAPCSASGIVRRHPDIRWLRRPSDIAALAQTQARLLDALWPLLAPGGRLLYCTCSVFRDEGQAQIDAFLQRRPDAIEVPAPRSPGHLLPLADNSATGSTPDARSSDGFFYSLLSKR